MLLRTKHIPIKKEENKNFFSVKLIFQEHWEDYLKTNSAREIEKAKVEKMLSCKGLERECFLFYCNHCKKDILMPFGCNSRICSCCGKRYTDNWADMLSNRIMKWITHRYLVFGIPDMLWKFFKNNRKLRRVFMNAVYKTIKRVFSQIAKKNIEPGCIEAMHPFGRNIQFQPHVHVIATQGGFDKLGKFVSISDYIDYDNLYRIWQYEILEALRKHLPNSIIDEAFRKYPDGFCAYVKPEKIKTSKGLVKYIGRYIRHPTIANSRIINYNHEAVKFYWEDNQGVIHYKIMLVHDFISAIIQHIPERNERLVRYYGCYSRKKIGKSLNSVKQSFIQAKLFPKEKKKRIVFCPKCSQEAIFIAYLPKPPPKNKNTLDYLGLP